MERGGKRGDSRTTRTKTNERKEKRNGINSSADRESQIELGPNVLVTPTTTLPYTNDISLGNYLSALRDSARPGLPVLMPVDNVPIVCPNVAR